MLTALIAAVPDETVAYAVSALLTRSAHEILGKALDLTVVAVQFVDPNAWFIGGQGLRDDGRRAAFVNIRITDETNNKTEKARFIADVYSGLKEILGELDPVSYVLVSDVRATAYGYGGRTQEARFHDRQR